MVLESFIGPKLAENKPWLTFFLGFLCTTLGIFLGSLIFPGNSSLAIVFLTTIFFIPLFYLTMIYEEKKDCNPDYDECNLLKEHSKALLFFTFLFLGTTLAFMFWFLLSSAVDLPIIDTADAFSAQSDTISEINGKATSPALGNAVKHGMNIFENNIRVMIFCILFSFLYGSGAIFIITWNASVIGFALGTYVIEAVFFSSTTGGSSYIVGTGCAFLRYMIHGIPEIVGYFIAGLAGGIISAAFIKHDFGSEKFEKIMLDASWLVIISVGVLIVAAIMEVFLTPLILCM